jgi:hypothetical protein
MFLTNTPYYQGYPQNAENVICSFGATPHSLRAAADYLFGKADAPGYIPVSNN